MIKRCKCHFPLCNFFVLCTSMFFNFQNVKFITGHYPTILAPNQLIRVIRMKIIIRLWIPCRKTISNEFAHKTQKWAFLGTTSSYENPRNVTMVYSFLANLVSKVVQDFKEKSHKIAQRYLCVFRNYCAKYWGRGPFRPPCFRRANKDPPKIIVNSGVNWHV